MHAHIYIYTQREKNEKQSNKTFPKTPNTSKTELMNSDGKIINNQMSELNEGIKNRSVRCSVSVKMM